MRGEIITQHFLEFYQFFVRNQPQELLYLIPLLHQLVEGQTNLKRPNKFLYLRN